MTERTPTLIDPSTTFRRAQVRSPAVVFIGAVSEPTRRKPLRAPSPVTEKSTPVPNAPSTTFRRIAVRSPAVVFVGAAVAPSRI